jgi:hypothetical protein
MEGGTPEDCGCAPRKLKTGKHGGTFLQKASPRFFLVDLKRFHSMPFKVLFDYQGHERG